MVKHHSSHTHMHAHVGPNTHTHTLSHTDKSKHVVKKKGASHLPLHMQNCHAGIVGACQGTTALTYTRVLWCGELTGQPLVCLCAAHTLFACICGRNAGKMNKSQMLLTQQSRRKPKRMEREKLSAPLTSNLCFPGFVGVFFSTILDFQSV